MKFLKSMFCNNGRFWRRIITLALPITLQALLNNSVNMVDNIMIGTLGETTISAVGLANKYYFVLTLLTFGISSGAAVLVAQFWGSREIHNVKKVVGMAGLIALVGTMLMGFVGCVFPETVMRIFTPNAETIEIGSRYLRIVAISYPVISLTQVLTAALRGINEVKGPVIISFGAIMTNVVFNYILIFGKFGAPVMGVEGAALATLIARVVELAAILLLIAVKKFPVLGSIRELTAFDKVFLGKFANTVAPVICNEFMWGLGTTMYSLAFGRMGDASVAAITISQTAEQVIQVLFNGVSAATGVILGNEMGNNKLERAERYSKYIIVLQLGLAVVFSGITLSVRGIVVSFYDVSDLVVDYVYKCMLMHSLFLPCKMFNLVNITGILRSGGDTKAALILDTVGVWFWAVPLAFLGGLVWKLPIYWVYALIMTEEFLKFVFGFIRYRQKKWLKNLVI